MEQDKIPIVVGVTGHRRMEDEDKPVIKERVIESLKKIQDMCRGDGKFCDTPVIMLNAFAQGADMLCAEAAFELGIDVYAVLPRPKEKYIESFDDAVDRDKLLGYLERTKRQIIAPDIERNREWLQANSNMSDDSYEYRQLGIYMAEHSHILLALWDGMPPTEKFGCGTVEVMKFALEHQFMDGDHLLRPGTINDAAVIWVRTRRKGAAAVEIDSHWLTSNLATRKKAAQDGEEMELGDAEKSAKYIRDEFIISDNPPEYIEEIIEKTKKYNAETFTYPEGKVKLWQRADELDDYRKTLRYHYVKSDALSYEKNQSHYSRILLLVAILGTIVACTFLIYDDASLPYMIFPCVLALGLIVLMNVIGGKKGFHKNYIGYRAFAEALRIQFYLSMCLSEDEIITNVCDLYSWTQKVDMVWIDKAMRAFAVTGAARQCVTDRDEVIDVWIGNNKRPEGQLAYHSRKLPGNSKSSQKLDKLSDIFQATTVALYFVLCVIEILSACNAIKFWNGNLVGELSWRNFGAIVLGVTTIASLLMTSYWGKLSFDRKADDNQKMIRFYASANEKWREARKLDSAGIAKFVKEIAREEIVENGIWCSYVNENGLEINI